MAIRLLDAVSVADDDQWSNVGGANKVSSVLRPDDDDTSYVRNTGQNQRQGFYLDKLAGTAVQQVDILGRNALAVNGAPGVNQRLAAFTRLGTTDETASPQELTLHQSTSTWSYSSDERVNVGRPGGGGWSPDDFPGGGSGLKIVVMAVTSHPASELRLTTYSARVTFTPIPGGFILLLYSLGPVAGVLLRDLPVMSRQLWAVRGALIEPREYVEALREWRDYRWPRTFVLRAA